MNLFSDLASVEKDLVVRGEGHNMETKKIDGGKKEETMMEKIEKARQLFLELEERGRVREEAIEDARRVFCIRERLDMIRK